MEKNLVEQEREISDLVRRAQKNPDRTGNQRKETLRRLIDLTHSPYPNLKSYAAGHLKYFFKDFPELEEAAINAVYDLCEDQLPKIRIDGYTAIAQVSREQKKWVKRNADVLVQLLQSDEPDEVIVVKRALLEHLDMDPRVTLGVLCDQITPVDEPLDEEDQQTRDRLRALVLSFLTGEAKRAIVRRHASQAGSQAEEILINGLLLAITKSSNAEIELIIKDLLLLLPSYRPQSPRIHSLLQMLLNSATSSFREETRAGEPVSLKSTRFFLDLAGFLAIETRMTSPTELMRFYCTTLVSKGVLQKLAQDDQIWVITRTIEILAACEDEEPQQHEQLASFRKHVVGATSIFLEMLENSKMAPAGSWNACFDMLKITLRYKNNSAWTVPVPLVDPLRRIQDLSESQREAKPNAPIAGIQDTIRLLLPPVAEPIPKASSPAANTNSSQDVPSSNDANGKSDQLQPSSSNLPQDNNPPFRRMIISSRSRVGESITSKSVPTSAPGQQESASSRQTPVSSKRGKLAEDSPRSTKRSKKDEDGDGRSAPSLLSRMMGSSVSSSPASVPSAPSRRNDALRTTERHTPVTDDVPAAGFSIKGAAAKEGTASQRNSPSGQWQTSRSSSLLDRIKGGDSTSSRGRDRDPGGRKRRRGGQV